jgi:hypothetical protein
MVKFLPWLLLPAVNWPLVIVMPPARVLGGRSAVRAA